ncbi:hemerythrin domain-containing protein [Devosia sp.]|uniref:hemerythrin domain-containing protein n=1 Tax=Devosia sp. TaxID=1871048 RepID=UPI003BABADC1
MLLDIGFLDDSTRPVAPKLTGLTPEQRAPGEHLRMVHEHFRGEMALLRRLIERASAGAVSGAELTAEAEALSLVTNYRRFGTLCGQHCQMIHGHHSIEDQVFFPALRDQSELLARVADRLEAEHGVVHELLVRLMAAIGELADAPTRDNFEICRETYEALERVLLSHFVYEEDEIGDAIGFYGIGM